ncbi:MULTISPECIES: E2/UBC family protein [unclassified Sphingopyxis]|uniref:E2/UBC family protein n=1 Tax=unclassified Sphingopyxis TaxID=2614943 RepID=UPI002863F66C|nr:MULTISPECIES: E2/UBC family protein [unclassified Sphingopyxis]MDR7062450.1 hypothetical protein [Sphingopyxis sp. BE235]MDR7182850.1 hypothetical protein [Sphingopyxis sp. BE249]
MRREFNLGPDDIRVLEALGCPWETIAQGGARWLLLRQHPIPEGYNVAQADVAIRLDAYPAGMIDMVYFSPPLSRADGKVINNLSALSIDNRSFQQWSRHYPWRQGVDSLCTHLRRVRAWLKNEFKKR